MEASITHVTYQAAVLLMVVSTVSATAIVRDLRDFGSMNFTGKYNLFSLNTFDSTQQSICPESLELEVVSSMDTDRVFMVSFLEGDFYMNDAPCRPLSPSTKATSFRIAIPALAVAEAGVLNESPHGELAPIAVAAGPQLRQYYGTVPNNSMHCDAIPETPVPKTVIVFADNGIIFSLLKSYLDSGMGAELELQRKQEANLNTAAPTHTYFMSFAVTDGNGNWETCAMMRDQDSLEVTRLVEKVYKRSKPTYAMEDVDYKYNGTVEEDARGYGGPRPLPEKALMGVAFLPSDSRCSASKEHAWGPFNVSEVYVSSGSRPEMVLTGKGGDTCARGKMYRLQDFFNVAIRDALGEDVVYEYLEKIYRLICEDCGQNDWTRETSGVLKEDLEREVQDWIYSDEGNLIDEAIWFHFSETESKCNDLAQSEPIVTMFINVSPAEFLEDVPEFKPIGQTLSAFRFSGNTSCLFSNSPMLAGRPAAQTQKNNTTTNRPASPTITPAKIVEEASKGTANGGTSFNETNGSQPTAEPDSSDTASDSGNGANADATAKPQEDPISMNTTTNSDACFPSSANVQLLNGKFRRMDELRVGDSVRISNEQFSRVLAFTHAKPNIRSTFIRLETATVAVTLSPQHYLYIDGALATAASARPGDRLSIESPASMYYDSAPVISTHAVSMLGLYNPQTAHGDIVIYSNKYERGVVCSSYTTSVHPMLAHVLLSPLRWLDTTFGYTVPAFSKLLSDGSPLWAAVLPNGVASYKV